jgi:hypothetical protein
LDWDINTTKYCTQTTRETKRYCSPTRRPHTCKYRRHWSEAHRGVKPTADGGAEGQAPPHLDLSIFWVGSGSGWAEKTRLFWIEKILPMTSHWARRASIFGPGLGGSPTHFIV